MTSLRCFGTPRPGDLGLRRIANRAGMSVELLPNGSLFAIGHDHDRGRTLISQIEGAALEGGIGRLVLRRRDGDPATAEMVGPAARVSVAAGPDCFVWDGAALGIGHRVTLWLHPDRPVWLWRVDLTNTGPDPVACDAVLIQDLGLGDRGFVMNNEAYVSQYIDHHVARHDRFGPVVMSRQNLRQSAGNPWVAQGCLDGAQSFATDALQVMGPDFRATGRIGTGDLPGTRLQHEVACAAIQSRTLRLDPGAGASLTFFGLHVPDHPAASGEADLDLLAGVEAAAADWDPAVPAPCPPVRSLLQDAAPAIPLPLDAAEIDRRYPDRHQVETDGDAPLSFFVPDGAQNRHVVLAAKEAALPRRHGHILRSGQGMLLDETTLCATCWMHGVFASLLTIGNTSFHRLFGPSRDPYNITRTGGLRMLVETGAGWQLLAVPSAFEMGLGDCVWIYRLEGRTVTIRAITAGDAPGMQWRVTVEGAPCRFLVFGSLVLGERELDHRGRVAIDAAAGRISFRPDPDSLWGRAYPDAVYDLVTDTPGEFAAMGGDELLHADGGARGSATIAFRTRQTAGFGFAVTGALADPAAAEALAARFAAGVDDAALLDPARAWWGHVTRNLSVSGTGDGVAAFDTLFPWLAHNAMVHLTVPHGLEQSGGAAWGTRDVCQGPVEFLLALEHDGPVREILKTVFAQQLEDAGDWPQWFMLEPYAQIRDRHSHGDVIVWPLKALCDYVEATGDLTILDEPVPWRHDADLSATPHRNPISMHVEKLLATIRARFIPGTCLIRYGEGDWNDSLQPADPKMRDWMVSSWTVALLFQQLNRYAAVMDQAGQTGAAAELLMLARAMRADVNRHLIRDGSIAGYALFDPKGGPAELLLHPSDTRTGLSRSLLPMTRSIIAGLFSGDQADTHRALIRDTLLFADGVRLMDRPVAYHGGPETVFRRAESAAFFGREIGLMYVHAHLRYGEAMATLGDAAALWQAVQVVNPVTVADQVVAATPRQRNAYFSSSDAGFADRYLAGSDWDRMRDGTVPLDGGWRIYSSGPGLYVRLVLGFALGLGRRNGLRGVAPLLPADLGPVRLELDLDGRREGWDLSG